MPVGGTGTRAGEPGPQGSVVRGGWPFAGVPAAFDYARAAHQVHLAHRAARFDGPGLSLAWPPP